MSTWQSPAELTAANRAPATPLARSVAAIRAERRAWVILWLAFATCCGLAFSLGKVALDYVTTAEIDLTARVEASRGIVFVRGPSGIDARLTQVDRELQVGSVVETARASSATLRFYDGSRITVQPGARVELADMEIGRFTNRSTFGLHQTQGAVQYQAAGSLTVRALHATVSIGPGDTTVWVDADETLRVLVYEGEARVDAEGTSVTVAAGQRAEVGLRQAVPALLPRTSQLVPNGSFSAQAQDWETIDVQNGPRDVDGQRRFVDGPLVGGTPLRALRIQRESVTFGHGETGLRQKLNVDVSGYRSLYVQAWVRVDEASLSGGGQLGFEYPMILRVHYEGAQEGSRPDWVNGFYYANPENRPVRDAELIPQGQWILYRVDLMDQEESRRPYRLLDLEVLGQGHSYDARVADIRISGD